MPQKKPPGLKRGREASLHADFLLGTFLPFARASESPIAMACFLDLTVLPLLPLLSAPVFRRLIARLTSPDADLEYRAIVFSSCELKTPIPSGGSGRQGILTVGLAAAGLAGH
jgi:hypothetical protein